jgi:hypothetical protein
MNPRVQILSALLAIIAIAPRAEAEDPEWVRPSSGTFRELRKVSTEAADTLGEYLDAGHDWLYRRLQHWFEDFDVRFARSEQTAIVVPLSPLRIGFASEFVHRRGGFEFAATPDFEAAVRLPNLERRLRVFVTSDDLQESPGWNGSKVHRAQTNSGLGGLERTAAASVNTSISVWLQWPGQWVR